MTDLGSNHRIRGFSAYFFSIFMLDLTVLRSIPIGAKNTSFVTGALSQSASDNPTLVRAPTLTEKAEFAISFEPCRTIPWPDVIALRMSEETPAIRSCVLPFPSIRILGLLDIEKVKEVELRQNIVMSEPPSAMELNVVFVARGSTRSTEGIFTTNTSLIKIWAGAEGDAVTR